MEVDPPKKKKSPFPTCLHSERSRRQGNRGSFLFARSPAPSSLRLFLGLERISSERVGHDILQDRRIIYRSVPKKLHHLVYGRPTVLSDNALHQSASGTPPQLAGQGRLQQAREAESAFIRL